MAGREADRCGSSPVPCLSHGTRCMERLRRKQNSLDSITPRPQSEVLHAPISTLWPMWMLIFSGGRGADPTAVRSARAYLLD